MNNFFNAELFRLAQDSPEFQGIFLNALTDKYTIPTGNMMEDIINSVEPDEVEEYEAFIKEVENLTIAQLAKIIADVSKALTVAESKGVDLNPLLITLKDIDVTALAVFAVAMKMNIFQQKGIEA